ncbi:MAG: response regulator transcription factor, partial [Acidimicrobiales bacterium]
MSSAGRPRVVLVDDHGLFRAGVRAELGGMVNVVGEADDVSPAIELISQLVPDVVLLDVHLPSGGGQHVVRGVLDRGIDVRFLALSVSDAPEDVIAVIRAGARGYVTKTISATDLVDAVVRVSEGDAVFSPRLAGFVLDAFSSAIPPTGPPTGAPGGAATEPGWEPEALRQEYLAGSRPLNGAPAAGAHGAWHGPSTAGGALSRTGTSAIGPQPWLNHGVPPPGFDPELDQLTPREHEVLRLIARGYTYKELARELSISTK